jgi:hypothetical protein
MMVDSRGMAIPLVISNVDELSDVLSIPYASRIPKQPDESDRGPAACAPLPDALAQAGPAAGLGTRGTILVPQGPAWWSSGFPSGDSSAMPSRPVRVEGRGSVEMPGRDDQGAALEGAINPACSLEPPRPGLLPRYRGRPLEDEWLSSSSTRRSVPSFPAPVLGVGK